MCGYLKNFFSFNTFNFGSNQWKGAFSREFQSKARAFRSE